MGPFLLLYALVLTIPMILAGYYQFFANPADYPQPPATGAFALTMLTCICLAIPCIILSRKDRSNLHRRDALIISVLIWFLTPAIGALPFIFSGTVQRFDQAYLESVSGFSTTGVSTFEAKQFDPQTGVEIPIKKTTYGIQENSYEFYGNINPVTNSHTGELLIGLEAVNRAILFWRNFTEWLGGIGIIVLFVAFLPALGVEGKFLFQTEMPGLEKTGFTPRIKETALQLLKIYVGLTFIQTVLLLLTNSKMGWLDAITISFSTLSTGGMTIHPNSIAYYNNIHTEWITLVFMILAGINFTLYYHVLKGKIFRLFDQEFILYLVLLIVFGVFTTSILVGQPQINLLNENLGVYSFFGAIRHGFFQIVSALTSTGLYTTNYETWPMVLQALILIAMFLGAMSGSTSGGIKLIRVYMLFQITKYKIESIFRPKTVKILRIGQRELDSNTIMTVQCFLFLVLLFFVMGTFVFILDNIDSETSLSLSVSLVTNTGFGFGLNGPAGSLAFLSPLPSYFSSFLMILGRLEYFAVLALFLPAFWKENT